MPKPGAMLVVLGVAHDDVLNVRHLPGLTGDIIATLHPLADDFMFAGRARQLPSSIWWEITTADGVTGWVSGAYTAAEGVTDDTTAEIVAQIGHPSGDSIEAVGLEVAESVVPDGEEEYVQRIVIVVAASEGTLGEITYDVVGVGDDAVRGQRLHIFLVDEDDNGHVRLPPGRQPRWPLQLDAVDATLDMGHEPSRVALLDFGELPVVVGDNASAEGGPARALKAVGGQSGRGVVVAQFVTCCDVAHCHIGDIADKSDVGIARVIDVDSHVVVFVGVTGREEHVVVDLQREVAKLRGQPLDFVEVNDVADLYCHALTRSDRFGGEHGQTAEIALTDFDVR